MAFMNRKEEYRRTSAMGTGVSIEHMAKRRKWKSADEAVHLADTGKFPEPDDAGICQCQYCRGCRLYY